MMAAETLRPDVVEKRAAFMTWIETVDARRLVMVDESGIAVGARLRYDYARRGMRCVDRSPARHGRRLSLMGWTDSLGHGAVLHKWGTAKGPDFEAFCERALVPVLEEGGIVVWDNAKVHGNVALRAAIEARGDRGEAAAALQSGLQPDRDAGVEADIYGARRGFRDTEQCFDRIEAHVRTALHLLQML